MLRTMLWLPLALGVLASPALALDRGPPAQSLGPARSPKLDLGVQSTVGSETAPCFSTDGHFATDGTSSWEPTCFGTFAATGQAVAVYPTRGTGKGPDGNPLYNMRTGFLIQAQGNGAIAKESNGQFINMDVVGGAESAARLDTTNTTGQLISIRQRPGPNGARPPTTWGHNIDFHIAPGAGNIQSYGVEYDMNNFNKDCAAGSGCLSSAMFFNGIGGYANTAWLYSGGGTTQTRNATGTISNGTITRVSGEAFTPGVYLLSIAGTSYHVHYVSADVAQADEPIPNFATASAYAAIRAAGQHRVVFDTTGDAAAFSLTSKAGQRACFNGFSGCLAYDEGFLRYEENGGRVVEFVSVPNTLNGLRITSSGAGGGPILEPNPNSTDANVPLNLRAKGASPVQVLGTMSATAGYTVGSTVGVSCSGPPTANFQVTNGIVTRC